MNLKEDALNRREIEAKIANVGDYVKMDYLQACLKRQIDFDTKKFVLTKLSDIYEERRMYLEAGKLIRIAADINTTYEGKMNDFLKSAILLIKAGNFDEADVSVAKAVAVANERQKVVIKIRIKDAYISQAQEFLKKDKRKRAMETYEKLLTLDLMPDEKKDARQALIDLYQKLGKVKEYYTLQESL